MALAGLQLNVGCPVDAQPRAADMLEGVEELQNWMATASSGPPKIPPPPNMVGKLSEQ